ncbi:MAG: transposase [Salinibacterium sp.]|nr:transposase [Salinibacterium sp.]
MASLITPPQILATIADPLYALAPAEFTAARNAAAREVKDSADLELAARVQELKKPSPAAWAVNLLARQRAEQLEQLADLGATMREAQEDLDREQLAELTRQRRALVNALAREASALAKDARHNLTVTVIEEVAKTLQAALNDPAAAAAVRSGRLVRGLEATGIEPVDLTDAVAAPEASMVSAPRPAAERKAVRDLAAVRAAKEAEKRADEADLEVRGVERRISDVETRRGRLESRLAELEEQVGALEDELRESDRDLRSLGRERDRAARRSADLRAEADKLRD